MSECNELIAVINNGIDTAEKNRRGKGDALGIAELRLLADDMDKLASDAAKVTVSIAELKDFSDRYQNMSKEIARHARELAAATEANENERVQKSRDAMDAASNQEDPLVEKINNFCGAR